MKTILIIIVLHSTAAITAIEFDDVRACERAAEELAKQGNVRTICTPKADVVATRPAYSVTVNGEPKGEVRWQGRRLAWTNGSGIELQHRIVGVRKMRAIIARRYGVPVLAVKLVRVVNP